LDRPTQLDAYLGLPFIPNSSLRGVWRNWWEVHKNDSVPADTVFGTRDDPEKPARAEPKPGKLIVGNGDLLTFPLLAETGERVWIFSLHHLCKYIELEKLYKQTTDIRALAAAIYGGAKEQRFALGVPKLPLLNTPFQLKQINIPALQTEIQALRHLLDRWCGDWIPPSEMLLVVDDDTASFLWQRAAEVRDLTALERNNKVAQAQSLRRVETIPEGSVFLSLVTWAGAESLDFGETAFQIGSGEGRGSGFCRMATSAATSAPAANVPIQTEDLLSGRERDDETMAGICAAIEKIAREESAAFKKKLNAAIKDWGWRMKNEGAEAALAFAFAKAKISRPAKVSDEAKAYRQLLQLLLKTDEAVAESIRFNQEISPVVAAQIMQRWLWLRKFSELEFEE
jgi:CRISPR/Cas system CMR subunit Cmr4 (Cas7 group RAMP superfamily)